MKLVTERLNILEISEQDLPFIIELNSDKLVMEYFPKILSSDESKAYLDKLIHHQKTYGFSMFPLFLNSTNEFVGLTGLFKPSFETDFSHHIEIGWKIFPKFWGKGFVTEASKACLNFAFNQLNQEKIISFTSKINLKSQKVMERLNMKYVKNFNHPFLKPNSLLSEHVLFELEKKDFMIQNNFEVKKKYEQ